METPAAPSLFVSHRLHHRSCERKTLECYRGTFDAAAVDIGIADGRPGTRRPEAASKHR